MAFPDPSRSAALAPSATLIVQEVLSSVLAPHRMREVLAESLVTAGLDDLPDEVESLRSFVEGALFTTVARHLDVPDGLELVAQIRAALALAYRAEPDDRPASHIRAGLTMARPRQVIVVSGASLVVFLLQDVLGEAIDVMPATTAPVLRDRLRRSPGPVVVVVDRKHPCVDESICELLAEELPKGSTVLWWGAHGAEIEAVRQSLCPRPSEGPRLVPCALEMQLADVGDVCRALLS